MDKYDVVFYVIVVVNYIALIYALVDWSLHPVLVFPGILIPFVSVIGIALLTLVLDAYNRLKQLDP